MQKLLIFSIFWSFILLLSCEPSDRAKIQPKTSEDIPIYDSHDQPFIIDTLATGLQVPWAIDWLPNGKAILSERKNAQLKIMDPADRSLKPIKGLPDIYQKVDGGMLDIKVHPKFTNNQWLYFAYSVSRPDSSSTTVVDRARLEGDSLVQRQRLFTALPYYKSDNHYGCRLLLTDGYLFISVGDRFRRDSAQTLRTHNGKIIRLYEDGRIPGDNPFVSVPAARPEIWSFGHRNPQGMALHPVSGEVWINEHGPKGGDEINIVRSGRNYGWPVITYGSEYAGGQIGEGLQQKTGMEQPLYFYKPSIAPSDMLFYTGRVFPNWKGDLFIGALALRHLNRLQLDGEEVVREERLLNGLDRIRCISQGPDDLIYLGLDPGLILRLKPAPNQ